MIFKMVLNGLQVNLTLVISSYYAKPEDKETLELTGFNNASSDSGQRYNSHVQATCGRYSHICVLLLLSNAEDVSIFKHLLCIPQFSAFIGVFANLV